MTFVWWHLLAVWAPMAPTFWSIWHIWRHAFPSWDKKVAWLALVVFVPVIGGLIYIFFGRKYARGSADESY